MMNVKQKCCATHGFTRLGKFFFMFFFLTGGFFLFHFTGKKDLVVLDLEFDEGKMPFLEIIVNGEKTKAALDLGAEITTAGKGVLPESILEKTGKKISISRLNVDFDDLDLFLIKELFLGSLRLGKVPFMIEPRETIPSYFPGEETTRIEQTPRPFVVLGNTLFQEMISFLDYKNKRYVLAKSLEALSKAAMFDSSYQQGKLLDSGSHFVIEGYFEGEKIKLAIDTGSTFNILFRPTEESSDIHLSKLGELTFNWEGKTFDISPIYTIQKQLGNTFEGFLGASFLGKHAVILDPKTKTCWIKAYHPL